MHDGDASNGRRPGGLTIVIPALNEEAAIGSTIQRCLDAREHIKSVGGVESIELIVVSDGSTDRTVEIARQFDEVEVIEFSSNRGYGAAIKAGFRHGQGGLTAFMDADGTCDPMYFADLCKAIETHDADIALGSRMSPESRMPRTRVIGNRLYAVLLGLLSNRTITDTASGMRVVRHSVLRQLGPLPDGLNYTPAMSARAILSGMRVVEVPIPYAERQGESKLRITRDGWRFLGSILDGALVFRPERLLAWLAITLIGVAGLIGLNPLEFYLLNRRVEEWMIYRFVVAFLLGSAGAFTLSAAAVLSRTAELALDGDPHSFWIDQLQKSFRGFRLLVVVLVLSSVSLWLLWPGILEYVRAGQVTLHWSRVIVAAFGLLLAFQAILTGMMQRVITLWLGFEKDEVLDLR